MTGTVARLLPGRSAAAVAALLLLPCGAVRGENMHRVHGHDYRVCLPGAEELSVRFPIVWDVRAAGENYRQYLRDYGLASTDDPVMERLEEAAGCGFNTALIRGELSSVMHPGEYGTYPSQFTVTANAARALGLDIMVGGFWTDPAADYHNMALVTFLSRYVSATAGAYPGDVIGVFGFDEPEVKYLENPESAEEWLAMVMRYQILCRFYLELPFSSFISKFGDFSGGEWEYYSDTTCVLSRFSRYLDSVILNSYPVTNNDRRTVSLPMDLDSLLFYGGTDLLPSVGPFYEAFCSRDELFAVTLGEDSCRLRLFTFGQTPGFEALELLPSGSLDLPILPDRMACSDFRTSDVGDRVAGTSLPNGAVVLWASGSTHEGVVVAVPTPEGVGIVRLPPFPGSDQARPLDFAVGEGGDACPPPHGSEGLLCRGVTVILGSYTMENGETALMVFSRTPGGFRLETPAPIPLRGFVPGGILWGRFWGTPVPDPDDRSIESGGFVAYDSAGRYVTCRPSPDGWLLEPVQASCFDGLFGGGSDPISVFVTREDQWYAPYCPGSDLVTAVLEHNGTQLVRARASERGEYLDSIRVTPLRDLHEAVLSAGAYRPDKKYGDVLLCVTRSGVSSSWDTMAESEEEGRILMVPLASAAGDTVLPGLRIMDTRRSIRAGVVAGADGFCLPGAQLYWDEYDSVRYEWFSQSFEVGMELGVDATPVQRSMLANVQAFGRHAFGLPFYCASVDTMLFLATEPVVKGCRGLIFYALDLALQSGGVREDGTRLFPAVLQNWGPSRDTGAEEPTGPILEAVALLTGHQPGGGPDFLEATVDSLFSALDAECAQNCQLGPDGCRPAPGDTLLNFLALENHRDGTILVMATNESRSPVPAGTGIQFPGRFSLDYEIVTVAGFAPAGLRAAADPDCREGSPAGEEDYPVLDMGGMPPLGVSLLELRPTFEGGGPGGSTFLEVACSGGSARVRFKTVGPGSSELRLYDLAGRFAESLWSGAGFPGVQEFTLDAGCRPPGVYFLVLVSGEYPIVSRVTLFP